MSASPGEFGVHHRPRREGSACRHETPEFELVAHLREIPDVARMIYVSRLRLVTARTQIVGRGTDAGQRTRAYLPIRFRAEGFCHIHAPHEVVCAGQIRFRGPVRPEMRNTEHLIDADAAGQGLGHGFHHGAAAGNQ